MARTTVRYAVFIATVMWATLAASVANAAAPPVNTVAPAISGTVQQGHVLTVSDGTWSSTEQLTYSYQWQQCDSSGAGCADISGANGSTYTPGIGDVDHYLTAVVTATDQEQQSTPASAAEVGLVKPPPPVNSSPPVISGNAQDGQTLTVVDKGTWSSEGTLTYSYEWRVCYLTGVRAGHCNEPPGENGSSLALSAAVVGQDVSVEVTAIDHVGQSNSYINDADLDGVETNRIGPIGSPPAPSNTTPPAISGNANDGQTLSVVSNGSWSSPDLLDYTYQWLRCDQAGNNCTTVLPGQDTRTYKLTPAEVGHYVTVQLIATDQERQHSAPALAGALGPVGNPPPPVPSSTRPPTISGVAQYGQPLTTSTGAWTSPDRLAYSYQWERCTDSAGAHCTAVAGRTSVSYKVTSPDAGYYIAVVITATDQESQKTMATAGPIGPAGNPPPPASRTVPVIAGATRVGRILKTSRGSWSSPDALTYSYQWERCAPGGSCTAISTATASSYTLVGADLGDYITVVVSATDHVGQQTPATAKPVGVITA